MSYQVPGGSKLIAADKDVHEMIKYLVYKKNEYIKEHGYNNNYVSISSYSVVVHGLDLLQYLVVQDVRGPSICPRGEMEEIVEQFKKAKIILDETTIKCIQHCIDVLEEYVQAFEIVQEMKKQCK